MTLREKQELFLQLLCGLITHVFSQPGRTCTGGELWRSDATAEAMAAQGKGVANSVHRQRLAIDLNLFLDGVWQQGTEAHREIGEWWEQQHPLCRWGGRFKDSKGNPKPDGNHYGLTHNGVS